MPIVATAGSGTKFEPCPKGLHQAVCCDVVDMGVLEVTYAGKTKKQHKVRVVWQVDEARDDGKPFIVQKRYTLSLHEKAALRADLENWRGKPFSDAELAGFDLENLIGANCQLNVIHAVKNTDTYANVAGIVPLGKGMQKIAVRDYVRVVDRKPEDEDEQEQGGGGKNIAPDEDDIPF